METPGARLIIVRSLYLILAAVVLLFGLSFYQKTRQRGAVVAELRQIAGAGSYFQQFYPEDARRTLVRAMGLLLESSKLGIPPDEAVDRALDLVKAPFDERDPKQDAAPRVLLTRSSLLENHAHIVKLGYTADHQTLTAMAQGRLPPLPAGPQTGRQPVVVPIIDPALSPGLDKVVANLTIRPPGHDAAAGGDVARAAAKQLAGNLAAAGVIEREAADRILAALSPP